MRYIGQGVRTSKTVLPGDERREGLSGSDRDAAHERGNWMSRKLRQSTANQQEGPGDLCNGRRRTKTVLKRHP